jgi:hypothetical protein
MGNPEQWQLDGSGPELYERYLRRLWEARRYCQVRDGRRGDTPVSGPHLETSPGAL